MLGVGFFFLQTNFDFLTSHFCHSKSIVVLTKRYFTCDHFFAILAILTNLGHHSRHEVKRIYYAPCNKSIMENKLPCGTISKTRALIARKYFELISLIGLIGNL